MNEHLSNAMVDWLNQGTPVGRAREKLRAVQQCRAPQCTKFSDSHFCPVCGLDRRDWLMARGRLQELFEIYLERFRHATLPSVQ